MKVNSNPLIIDNTTLKIKAHQNQLTLNQGTISETRRINIAFMTKVNNHIVRMFIGSVSNIKIGLMNALIIHKTIATIIAVQNHEITTQGRMYAVAKTARALISRLIKRDICRIC